MPHRVEVEFPKAAKYKEDDETKLHYINISTWRNLLQQLLPLINHIQPGSRQNRSSKMLHDQVNVL